MPVSSHTPFVLYPVCASADARAFRFRHVDGERPLRQAVSREAFDVIEQCMRCAYKVCVVGIYSTSRGKVASAGGTEGHVEQLRGT